MSEQPKIQFVTGSGKYWRLLETVSVELSDGKSITVPAGYVYDLASIPRFLWFAFPPFDDANIAYLVHDYMYSEDLYRKEMGDRAARLYCDKQMLYLANKYSPYTKSANHIKYNAVRLFGGRVFARWKDITAKRKKYAN